MNNDTNQWVKDIIAMVDNLPTSKIPYKTKKMIENEVKLELHKAKAIEKERNIRAEKSNEKAAIARKQKLGRERYMIAKRHICECCNYNTFIEAYYQTHLKSKKHNKHIEDKTDEMMKMIDDCCFDGPMPIDYWNIDASEGN